MCKSLFNLEPEDEYGPLSNKNNYIYYVFCVSSMREDMKYGQGASKDIIV